MYTLERFDHWTGQNMNRIDEVEYLDNDFWIFLSETRGNWRNWETTDNFERYRDVAAKNIEYPFDEEELEMIVEGFESYSKLNETEKAYFEKQIFQYCREYEHPSDKDECRLKIIERYNKKFGHTSSKEIPIRYKGKPKIICLNSQILNYRDDTSYEQQVIIKSDGDIEVTCNRLRNGLTYTFKNESHHISPRTANTILKEFSKYVLSERKKEDCKYIGNCKTILVKEDGQVWILTGEMKSGAKNAERLSDLLRKQLGIPWLYVLDGKYRSDLERIEVKYHCSTKKKPKVFMNEKVESYDEKLIIDRKTETIEYNRIIGDKCKICNSYYIKDAVSDFLDNMDYEAFFEKSNTEARLNCADLENIKKYSVSLCTKDGNKEIIKGVYNRDGIPYDWTSFMHSLKEFVLQYGIGDIFDRNVYNKPVCKKKEYMIYMVKFNFNYKAYAYFAYKDDYGEGDLVVVSVGSENEEKVGVIESIECWTRENAPFPLSTLKPILRKYEGDMKIFKI